MGFLIGGRAASKRPRFSEINFVKSAMVCCLQGCNSASAFAVKRSIYSAVTIEDLWMLRSNLFNAIACGMSQEIATDRVNSLLPLFCEWIEAARIAHARLFPGPNVHRYFGVGSSWT